jgi:hypothetical protein
VAGRSSCQKLNPDSHHGRQFAGIAVVNRGFAVTEWAFGAMVDRVLRINGRDNTADRAVDGPDSHLVFSQAARS